MGWRLKCGMSFKNRSGFRRIFEFYAATEAASRCSTSRANGGDRPRSGLPRPSFSPVLVRFDVEKGEPVRNEQGFCIRCAANEIGEAIGKVSDDPSNAGSRFEGYTSKEDSERKILRDVFEPGDLWVRTGDLMRKDDRDFSISSIVSATRSAGRVRTLRPPRSRGQSVSFRGSRQAASTAWRSRPRAGLAWRRSLPKTSSTCRVFEST